MLGKTGHPMDAPQDIVDSIIAPFSAHCPVNPQKGKDVC